jgi:ribosomal protein L15
VVVVLLVVVTITVPTLINTILGQYQIPPVSHCIREYVADVKSNTSYFGKVGMRHFHLMRNLYWRPIINVDKLWSLVPAEEKKNLSADSKVVPVVDTLRHGYAKVLGNGKLPKLPFIVKARFVSEIAE